MIQKNVLVQLAVVTKISVPVTISVTHAVLRLVFSLSVIASLNSCGMNVRPSQTTVTYGESNSQSEKDAKNDTLTDSKKQSWQIKQVFKWGKE